METERRAVPRMVTTIPVEAFDGGPPLYAQDIGLGGMMVTTRQPRWPGALIRVRLRLPRIPPERRSAEPRGHPPGNGTPRGSSKRTPERAIRATCRVVALSPAPRGVGLALTFLELAPEAEQAIARFVDERPLPDYDDLSIASKVNAWVARMVEDCQQLKALART